MRRNQDGFHILICITKIRQYELLEYRYHGMDCQKISNLNEAKLRAVFPKTVHSFKQHAFVISRIGCDDH